LSAALSKEMLETGTHFTLSHSSAENTDRNEELSQIQIEQDLLKNAFGKEQRFKKDILEKKQKIQQFEALENYESFLASHIKEYLDFSQAAIEVDLSESLLDSSKSLYSYVNNKYKKNAANITDLKRARLQDILKEEEFIEKRENYESIKQRILLSISLDDVSLSPEMSLDLFSIYPNMINSFDVKRLRRYQMVVLQQELVAEEYQIAKDEDLAELSLLGAYKIDQSTRFTNTVNRNESSVGIRLSMPFKNTKASAQKKIKALDVKYGQLDQIKVSKELEDEYQTLDSNLQKLKKQFVLSQEKLKLMKDVLDDESLRYRRGRIDTDKILEANNTYAVYQFENYEQLLALNKSYIDWLVLNDQLVKSK